MRHTWRIVAGVIVIVGLLWVVIVAAPPWFVQHRSLDVATAQNDVRTTLLQGLGGVVLLVGAYFTYRQLINSREQLAHSHEQLQLAQQGQITERFTRAIDQLGHAQLDVRLGGIYALERIARDSSADRATVGEVLTAFIRSHAPWPPRLPGQYVAEAPIDEVPDLQVRAPDVQASLTVLRRGGFAPPVEGESDRLDLHASDLRNADLHDAQLDGVILRDAHLEGAKLDGAQLRRADLQDAHLKEADLAGAHLEEAELASAHLEEATLIGAHLEGADLIGVHLEKALLHDANLKGADLTDTHLKDAGLQGACLEGADLFGARLEGAQANAATVWPRGLDWHAHGVRVVEEEIAASDP